MKECSMSQTLLEMAKDLVLEQEGRPVLQRAIALCLDQGDSGHARRW